MARNRDIVGEMRVSVPTSEQYSVFRVYLDSRHRDGAAAADARRLDPGGRPIVVT
jgi:arginine-tRNA-protein transferase